LDRQWCCGDADVEVGDAVDTAELDVCERGGEAREILGHGAADLGRGVGRIKLDVLTERTRNDEKMIKWLAK
jgi:hypothetical protein